MPDLIRHPVFAWISAIVGMTQALSSVDEVMMIDLKRNKDIKEERSWGKLGFGRFSW
jgi:hypothetical protein